MKWLKLFLGGLILAFALISTSNLIVASGPPDTEYTRLLAAAVERGDQRMPRVPGKFVHIRVRQVLPGKLIPIGHIELWLGPDGQESTRIDQDSQGKIITRVTVRDNIVTTNNFRSGWSDEMALDSADIAARLTEGAIWGHHQAILNGKAGIVTQTASTIVIRLIEQDNDSDQAEVTLDRKTHLPISVQNGLAPIQNDYQAIEITSQPPPAVVAAPPVQSATVKLTLSEARRFTKFPLYYLGEEFGEYRLADIQYTYQKLRRELNLVGLFYRRKGQTTGDAPAYVTVEPKSQAVLDSLAEKARAGLVAADGQVGKVPTGHVLMLVMRDDAVVWLYGPDEATVRSMRASLRPLR